MRSRFRSLPLVTSLAAALLLVVAPVAHAQDASLEPSPSIVPSAFCAVLTPEEVSTTLGVDVTITESSDVDCSYQSDFNTGDFLLLAVFHQDDSLAEMRDFYTDYTDVTIGDSAGIIAPDASLMYVDTGDGVLAIQLVGTPAEGIEAADAVKALGELAIPRLAGIPLPTPEPLPSDFPLPSFMGDPDLAALFPTSIGGEELSTQTLSGPELQTEGDPEQLQPVVDFLASQGKTLDDVSLGFAFGGSAAIQAIRIRGVDASAILADFLPLLLTDLSDPIQEPATLSGKSVIKVTDGGDETADPRWIYAHDDVIWQVSADEPDLSETIAALP